MKKRIPSITSLVTAVASRNAKAAGTWNNIPNTFNFILKKDKAKITETEIKITKHDKYITTHEFNKLSDELFNTKIKQKSLATKANISNFIDHKDSDENQEILRQKQN